MDKILHQLTAFGSAKPTIVEIGSTRISERFDVALASIATRHGQEKAFATAAKKAKIPLVGPAQSVIGAPYGCFWVAPEMWFVEAPFVTHKNIVAKLKPIFGDTASITEQTDAWLRLDMTGEALAELFARLCNLDLAALPDAYASRTVIEHLGCYLIRHNINAITLYGPRSSAASLLHALEITAKSLI